MSDPRRFRPAQVPDTVLDGHRRHKSRERLWTAHQSHTKARTCIFSESQSIKEKSIALDQVAKPFSLTASTAGLANVMYIVLSACVRDAHFSHNGESHMHVSDARGDAGSGCLVQKV